MKNRTAIKPYKRCKKCGNFIVSGTLCEDCKPMTNGDRIRNMTDEELAEWLDNEAGCNMCQKHPTQCDIDCYSGYLEWLKQEVIKDAESDTEEP